MKSDAYPAAQEKAVGLMRDMDYASLPIERET
jgi:hypothetical protein